TVAKFPETNQRIGTYVMNHELTLAKSIMRALIIEDGAQAGQMIHKEPEPDEVDPPEGSLGGPAGDAENPDLARFCASCGGRMTATCSECGAKVALGARFCTSCG